MTIYQWMYVLILLGYFAGAIPFGLIVAKSKGVDPRTSVSGNIGATNVGRLLGMKFFAIVFTLDMLKGLAPMAAASWVLASKGPALAAQRSWDLNLLHLLVGFACICGHMFSVFLKFKGGKGVATSAGVALGLFPFFTFAGLAGLAVWGVVYGISRYVSLASMLAAGMFPVAFVVIGQFAGWHVLGNQLPLLLFAILVAVMIVWRHRSNIARLRSGTESRFTGKAS